jgi:hypothetical protein
MNSQGDPSGHGGQAMEDSEMIPAYNCMVQVNQEQRQTVYDSERSFRAAEMGFSKCKPMQRDYTLGVTARCGLYELGQRIYR